jgi:hypothetical protein
MNLFIHLTTEWDGCYPDPVMCITIKKDDVQNGKWTSMIQQSAAIVQLSLNAEFLERFQEFPNDHPNFACLA